MVSFSAPQNGDKGGTSPYTILLAIDYGTKYLRVAMQFVRKGQIADPQVAVLLRLDGHSSQIEQTVAFVGTTDGIDFSYGHPAGELHQGLVREDSKVVVIDKLKSLLFPSEKTEDHGNEIIEELVATFGPERGLYWALQTHLQRIREDSMTAIETSCVRFTKAEISNMPVHAIFTVPESTDPGRRRLLRQVIEECGFMHTTICSETEAAAAWACYLHFRFLRLRGSDMSLKRGKEIVVGDAGGTTFNVAAYLLRSSCDGKNHMTLEATGRSMSKLYGSEMLTQKFVNYAKSTITHEDLCELGMSASDFRRCLAKEFEAVKCGIGAGGPTEEKIVAIPAVNGNKRFHAVTITPWQMRAWIDELATNIADALRVIISKETQYIVLTGGFFRNLYLRTSLVKHPLLPRGIDFLNEDYDGLLEQSVARGAVSRIQVDNPTPQPMNFAVGWLVDQPFDEEVHAPGDQVREDKYSGSTYASNRWLELLPKGCGEQDFVASYPERFLIHPDEPELWKQLFWTDTDIKPDDWAHEWKTKHARFEGEPRKSALRQDIQEYGVELTIDIDPMVLKSYPTVKPNSGEENDPDSARHLVWATISVSVHGLDQRISWKLEPPGIDLDTESLQAGRARLSKKRKHGKTLGNTVLENEDFRSTFHRGAMIETGDVSGPTSMNMTRQRSVTASRPPTRPISGAKDEIVVARPSKRNRMQDGESSLTAARSGLGRRRMPSRRFADAAGTSSVDTEPTGSISSGPSRDTRCNVASSQDSASSAFATAVAVADGMLASISEHGQS